MSFVLTALVPRSSDLPRGAGLLPARISPMRWIVSKRRHRAGTRLFDE
jgi:hypothetical protein